MDHHHPKLYEVHKKTRIWNKDSFSRYHSDRLYLLIDCFKLSICKIALSIITELKITKYRYRNKKINGKKIVSFTYWIKQNDFSWLIQDTSDWIQEINVLYWHTTIERCLPFPTLLSLLPLAYSLLHPPVWALSAHTKLTFVEVFPCALHWSKPIIGSSQQSILWDRFSYHPQMMKLEHKSLSDKPAFTQLRCSIQEM